MMPSLPTCTPSLPSAITTPGTRYVFYVMESPIWIYSSIYGLMRNLRFTLTISKITNYMFVCARAGCYVLSCCGAHGSAQGRLRRLQAGLLVPVGFWARRRDATDDNEQKYFFAELRFERRSRRLVVETCTLLGNLHNLSSSSRLTSCMHAC